MQPAYALVPLLLGNASLQWPIDEIFLTNVCMQNTNLGFKKSACVSKSVLYAST